MINSKIASFILNAPSWIIKPISRMVTSFYIDKYAKIEVSNYRNLDKIEEPVIFVCNHLSNSDGLLLNKVLKRFKPYFVAGVKLASNPVSRIGLEAVNIIPIHPNTPDTEALRKCIEKIKEGKSVLIFPEGTRSRTGKMIEGKKGVVLIAKKTGVKIVPLGIIGSEKLMPINDNDMSKEKFNYANVKINVGEPFMLPEKLNDEKDSYNEKCLNMIMIKIAELLPEEYRGVYADKI